MGFLTKGAPTGTGGVAEEYMYAIEVTPTDVVWANQPRMAPVVDDVQIVYLPDSGVILEEVELVD